MSSTVESLRILIHTQHNRAPDDYANTNILDVPPDIRALFEELLASDISRKEIVDLLCILSNIGAADWDQIAHLML